MRNLGISEMAAFVTGLYISYSIIQLSVIRQQGLIYTLTVLHNWVSSDSRPWYIHLQYYTTECHPTAGLGIYTYSTTQLSVIRQQALIYTLTVLHNWVSSDSRAWYIHLQYYTADRVSSDSRPWYIHLQYYTTECHPTAGFGIYMLGLKCAVSGYACSLFMSCVETGKSEDLYICNKGSKYFLWNT